MNNIIQLHKLFLQYPIVCTNSKKACKNSLFFALKGDNFDGNIYAKEALSKGCKYAVVDSPIIDMGQQYILVDDVLKTLQDLAKYHRQYCNVKIIGLTGSNGKTTTKELIYEVLSEQYNIVATHKNLNNHIGVPLTLLNLTPDTDIGVIEMGANHLKEIEFLCNIADPDFGLITNIGMAHIEGFGSFEGVVQTKMELYKYIASKGGTIFVNADNTILCEEAKKLNCSTYFYGKPREDINVSGVPLHKKDKFFFYIDLEGDEIATNLVGSYNFENILSAYAVGNFFEVPKVDMLRLLQDYTPNSRSQLIETNDNTIILDCYNANPSSMNASLVNFIELSCNNKFIILGDMLELGRISYDAHNKIKKLIQKHNLAKNTWLVGDEFAKNKDRDFTYFDNIEKVINHLKKEPLRDKTIIIKGSNSIKLEKLKEFL